MADIEFYRKHLKVNKHALDDDLEYQSQYQDEISRCLAQANSAMLQAKEDLSQHEARLLIEMKEEKVSNELAAARIKQDRDRSVWWKTFQLRREEHEEWLGLYDSWQRRGYSIKTLADLYVAQYFTVTSTTRSTDDRERLNASRRPLETNTRRRVAT